MRKCVEVYSRIAAQRPEMILKPPNPLMPLPSARSVREGRRNALLPWPVRLGVGIRFDERDQPHLTFEKEEFSLSEQCPISNIPSMWQCVSSVDRRGQVR